MFGCQDAVSPDSEDFANFMEVRLAGFDSHFVNLVESQAHLELRLTRSKQLGLITKPCGAVEERPFEGASIPEN